MQRRKMYVHLLSNASMDVFPDNKLGDFSTILNHPLLLSGSDEWEVGLVEMNVPFALDMVTKNEAWIEWVTYDIASGLMVEKTEDTNQLAKHGCFVNFVDDHYEVIVPDGYYLRMSKAQCGLPTEIYGDSERVYYGEPIEGHNVLEGDFLLYTANRQAQKYLFKEGYYEEMNPFLTLIKTVVGNKLSLTFNNATHMVHCQLNEDGFVKFSNQLSNILGFRNQSIQQRSVVAHHTPDPFPGINCILVFTNIIEEQFVGHDKAPLLRLTDSSYFKTQ